MAASAGSAFNLFRRRVGRRVFALFVVCALVPVSLVALLSYDLVIGELEKQAGEHLRRETKSISVALYERLLGLENAIQSVAAALVEDSGAGVTRSDRAMLRALIGDRFGSVSLFDGDAGPIALVGPPLDRPMLGDESVAHLAAGHTLLITLPGEDVRRVLMLRRAGRWLVVAEAAAQYLWHTDLDPDQHVCFVNKDLVALNCEPALFARWSGALSAGLDRSNTGEARVADDRGGAVRLHYKSLFLEGRFGAPSWVTVLGRGASDQLLASVRFKQIFPSVLLLSLLMVLLLSLVQIRRFLVPLERLREGTRRLAEQDFSTPVLLDSRDEFEELAVSFNRMSASLEEMFSTLERFSELDTSILTAADRDEVLDTVTARLPELLDCDAAALVSMPLDGAPGNVRVVRPPVAYDPEHDIRVLDAATARYTNQHGYVQILEHTADLPPGLAAVVHKQPARVLWLPVELRGQVVCVFCCGFVDGEALTERRLLNAQDLAHRLVLALTDALKGEALQRQACFDALTGLPNRHVLNQRLERSVERAREEGDSVALLFMDLDRFKAINDSLGHATGDRLLQRIAERLAMHVRDGDTVARFGGDEFVILLPASHDTVVTRARTLASALTVAVREPCDIDGRELSTSTSIGISVFPQLANDAADMLSQADIALYHAKRQGRDTWQLYSADLMDEEGQRLQIEGALRSAMAQGGLELHYQPLVDPDLGRVHAVEALLRWPDCPLGPIGAQRFISVAEESRLINEVGSWVLRTACTQLRTWHDSGLRDLTLCINLSPRQFRDPDLPSEISRILDETGLSPGHLELEVTENTLMHDIKQASLMLRRLRSLGVGVSIDDFGTGHSSLEYLTRLPANTFKVDRSFVARLHETVEASVIVETLVEMAHKLGMTVVAEGVETQAQYDFLHARGCNLIQGYFYARPMPAGEFLEWHRRGAPLPATGAGVAN